jgi:nucleotide-binding universal stress UspA family protein
MGGSTTLSTVLAAIDNSLACRSVLATARALATVLAADVEALHVPVDGDRTARGAAEAAEVPLRIVEGPVIESLVEAGEADSIAAVVIGSRRLPNDRRPLGATALAVATRLSKPVVIVPLHAPPPAAIRRVLVPLEGTTSTSLAPRSIFELARGQNIEVLALHILDAQSIPAFTDQPQHEQIAWAHEFLARYCPWGIGAVRLETRVGASAVIIPEFAEESKTDLIALGWARELAPGRAPVVRAALGRARIPVMLIPVLDTIPPQASA